MRPFVIIVSALLVVAASACADLPPAAPPASEAAGLAPPTDLERTMLGPDANNSYFLSRFRACAAWASYTYCQADLYGGLTP